ncbi:hypothetical protein [Escherichia coli]|uniref:hypothetical protein n=3 Tax=Escherichia coli TaxID=562 RepID=UPI003B587930
MLRPFFFSDKECRWAPLFTAPADAARQERCLWSVSRVRRARDGRFYRSRLASVTVYASPSPFSDERPSSRFRGISSGAARLAVFHDPLTPPPLGTESGQGRERKPQPWSEAEGIG